MSNTGYIRATKFALKILKGNVESIVNYNINDSFDGYSSIPVEILLSMSQSDYEDRVSSFLSYLENTYSGFNVSGVTNSSRFQSNNCKILETTLSQCYEYLLSCSGNTAIFESIDCQNNIKRYEIVNGEELTICSTNVSIISGDGIITQNGNCEETTTTIPVETPKLGVYDLLKNANVYDNEFFNIDDKLSLYLVNEGNVIINIIDLYVSGDFSLNQSAPINLLINENGIILDIEYTGDEYQDTSGILTIITTGETKNYYLVREGFSTTTKRVGVIEGRNTQTNELIPNQTIINERVVGFKLESLSGTSEIGGVIVSNPDFILSGLVSGSIINENTNMEFTLTYIGSGSTGQTTILINRLDGGNTLYFEVVYNQNVIIEIIGEYLNYDCELIDDNTTTLPNYELVVNNGIKSGRYYVHEDVSITGNTPQTGYEFKSWTGNTEYLVNTNNIITSLQNTTGGILIEVGSSYKVIGSLDPFFTFDINNTLATTSGFFEIDFNSDQTSYSGAFSQEEIGNAYVDAGEDNLIYPTNPFPQPTPDDYNGGIWYSYSDSYGLDYYVNYQTTGLHTVNVYSDGDKAAESVWLLYMYDLYVVGDLNLSMFTNISNFEIMNANISSITVPQSVHPEWGLDDFQLYRVNQLTEIDFSGMALPDIPINNSTNNISITECQDLQTVTLPSTNSDMRYLTISDNPNLTNIYIGSGSTMSVGYFDISINPSLGYFDVKQIPNLTKALLHNTYGNYDYGGTYYFTDNEYDSATVNRILVDLDSISETISPTITLSSRKPKIYINGVNSNPDSTSGGYDGITAKNSLIAKGFNVYTN